MMNWAIGLLIGSVVYVTMPLYEGFLMRGDVGLGILLLIPAGLSLGIPLCAIPCAVVSLVAFLRDRRERPALVALTLCVVAAAMWAAGRYHQNGASQHGESTVPVKAAPSAPSTAR